MLRLALGALLLHGAGARLLAPASSPNLPSLVLDAGVKTEVQREVRTETKAQVVSVSATEDAADVAVVKDVAEVAKDVSESGEDVQRLQGMMGRRMDRLTAAVQSIAAQFQSERGSAEHTVSVCALRTTCDSCARAAECGWCASEERCVPGNEQGPVDSLSSTCSNYDFGTCSNAPCSSNAGCKSCLSDVRCGWCDFSSTCTNGGIDGPTPPAAAASAGSAAWAAAAAEASQAVCPRVMGKATWMHQRGVLRCKASSSETTPHQSPSTVRAVAAAREADMKGLKARLLKVQRQMNVTTASNSSKASKA